VLIVDGVSGRIVVEPGEADLREFARLQRENERERRTLARLKGAKPTARSTASTSTCTPTPNRAKT
jgi:phosphoenolpyruvate-protein kinase (PTS system EI component)